MDDETAARTMPLRTKKSFGILFSLKRKSPGHALDQPRSSLPFGRDVVPALPPSIDLQINTTMLRVGSDPFAREYAERPATPPRRTPTSPVSPPLLTPGLSPERPRHFSNAIAARLSEDSISDPYGSASDSEDLRRTSARLQSAFSDSDDSSDDDEPGAPCFEPELKAQCCDLLYASSRRNLRASVQFTVRAS